MKRMFVTVASSVALVSNGRWSSSIQRCTWYCCIMNVIDGRRIDVTCGWWTLLTTIMLLSLLQTKLCCKLSTFSYWLLAAIFTGLRIIRLPNYTIGSTLITGCQRHAHCATPLIEMSTKMAQRESSRFSTPKQGVTAAETTAGEGHRSGSYTVTVDANPSVEQVQTYMMKSTSPNSYVPSSSEFDFMSSSLGSPSGTLNGDCLQGER